SPSKTRGRMATFGQRQLSKDAAIVCKHCGSDLRKSKPATPTPQLAQSSPRQERPRFQIRGSTASVGLIGFAIALLPRPIGAIGILMRQLLSLSQVTRLSGGAGGWRSRSPSEQSACRFDARCTRLLFPRPRMPRQNLRTQRRLLGTRSRSRPLHRLIPRLTAQEVFRAAWKLKCNDDDQACVHVQTGSASIVCRVVDRNDCAPFKRHHEGGGSFPALRL